MVMRAFGWLLALAGLLCLFVTGLAAAFLPELPTWGKVLGGVGVGLIGLWLFLDWGSLTALGKDQTVARSFTAGFAALLALAIVVTVNVVGHRFDKRWDLTEDKKYTLSQQSADIAAKLDREVEVIAFFQTGMPDGDNFRNLMGEYQDHTTLLKVEYKDPYENPLLAQEYKLTSAYGTVVLKAGDHEQRVESKFDEEAFTNALIKVTSEVEHTVCFVEGHNELDMNDESSQTGLGGVRLKLEGQNYLPRKIQLLSGTPKPDDCKVVVLASPQVDPLAGEMDKLAEYVAAGGNLVVLLDPQLAPNTAADMARYGIAVGNDVVIEGDPARQVMGGDPTFVALDPTSLGTHAITEKLKGGMIMRLVRSVGAGTPVSGVDVVELAHTTDKSWGETNLTSEGWEPDGTDRVGNVPVAAVAEVKDPANLVTRTVTTPAEGAPTPSVAVSTEPELPRKAGGKVVVYGDGDFASNLLVLTGLNQDLLLNAVAWMVGEADQVSIRTNEAGKGRLSLDVVSTLLSGTLALVVFPGVTIAGAIGTWLARRRL
jgi:hypothetical protein